MADQDTHDTLFIVGLGAFQARRDNGGFLGLNYFKKTHSFHGQTVDLIVYPNDDGTWPSEAQRLELTSRFKKFEAEVESALQGLPSHLAPLCRKYQINIDQLAASQMTAGFRWQNVKLEPAGEIECYTMNLTVTRHLNIVIRFSSAIIISEVYFDG